MFSNDPVSETEKNSFFVSCGSFTRKDVKPVPWVLKNRYARGLTTITAAPGGTGKSALSLLEAVSIVTGKQLTHQEIRETGPVWLINGEDDLETIQMPRVEAIKKYYGFKDRELKHLYIGSGRRSPLKFAGLDDKGRPVANEKAIKFVIDTIKRNGIILLGIDPLVKCHSLKENSNDDMDFLMEIFNRITDETGCAFSGIHHMSKGRSEYGNADKTRGGSAIMSAARIGHTLYPLDKKDAKKYGISPQDAGYFLRLDQAKGNVSSPGQTTHWFKKESIKLFFDSEDTTVVLKAISPPDEVEQIDPKAEVVFEALVNIFEEEKIHEITVSQASAKISEKGMDFPGGSSKSTIERIIKSQIFSKGRAEYFGQKFKMKQNLMNYLAIFKDKEDES
jgi:RecA-family ATPase